MFKTETAPWEQDVQEAKEPIQPFEGVGEMVDVGSVRNPDFVMYGGGKRKETARGIPRVPTVCGVDK